MTNPEPQPTRGQHHLVAGGGGFIGSHLVDLFLARGDQATIVDNFVTGRRSNIAHLAGDGRVTVIEHDITTPFPQALTDGRYDTVLDLASPASPADFKTMPLEILAVGSTGTRNLLELARDQNARFFLASTSEVYGDPLVHPQPETYWGNVSSIGPRSCYDEAKRFSEAIAMAYHRTHGVDVRIVRIFNTYGERMRPRDGRVVNTFVLQALRNEPLTLHGDGMQTRSFCHVADEVRGLAAVLDGNLTGPINVGNPDEFTMRELAELVIEITGSTSETITMPMPDEREGDPMQRCPDIALVRDAYGWGPSISLLAGLTRMIEWFRTKEDLT
ncbi:MAG: GDP-mannose 4,6-dehydratase [Ilumatobacteraceae bacterium]|nr:GDP-mannose 4,6-dehydratase [Ilumatobacteraceae bacterium]